MTNKDKFLSIYKENWKQAIKDNPKDYRLIRNFEDSFARMTKAIETNSFNKNGEAFRQTCKQLKIKHTYLAIAEFINN